MITRTLARVGLAGGGALVLGLALAGLSSAHVSVRPEGTEAGSHTKIIVRVPNESDTAGTVQVRLELPADTPFPSVRVQPRPGWTAELTRTEFPAPVQVGDRTLTDAVTAITWTADPGVRIGPDQFDEFAIAVALPEAGTYYLPAIQTYDDGEIVEWAEEPVEGGEEPDRPAPSLEVVEATSEDGHGGGAGADAGAGSGEEAENVSDEGDGSSSSDSSAAATDGDSSDDLARGVGIAGLVVGAAGLGIGAAALRRRNA